MSSFRDDLSQGGSYLSPDVWAMGQWVEVKPNANRFSEDTVHGPEMAAMRRMVADLLKAVAEVSRRAIDMFRAVFGGFAAAVKATVNGLADALRSFGLIADQVEEFASDIEPAPPAIRSIDYRRVSKIRPVAAYDRRPAFRTIGGREARPN